MLHSPRTMRSAFAIWATLTALLVPTVTLLTPTAAAADPTVAQVNSQIAAAEAQLEHTIEAYNANNESLERSQTDATAVTARRDALQGQLNAADGSVRELVAAAYRTSGGMSTVSALLAAGPTTAMTDNVSTVRYVNRSKQREISHYAGLKREAVAEQTRLSKLIADQQAQQRELAAKKTTIEAGIRDLQALRQRVGVTPTSSAATSGSAAAGPPPAVSGSASSVVGFAYAQLGKPYIFGAEGPGSYDCSGLTKRAWAQAGVKLPHNAAQQWNVTAHVSRANLQPGDLVFYSSLDHVALYIGNDKVIHAPTPGDVVKVSSVGMMPPYGFGRPR